MGRKGTPEGWAASVLWPERNRFYRMINSEFLDDLEARDRMTAPVERQASLPSGCSSHIDWPRVKACYIVLISRLRHKYQQATERYGVHDFAIFSMSFGLGHLRLR